MVSTGDNVVTVPAAAVTATLHEPVILTFNGRDKPCNDEGGR